jgi:hypothetical protein
MHNQAFLLAPVEAPDRFAEHVVTLWRQPEKRRAMGKAGEDLYSEHFTFEAAAGTVADRLQQPAPSDLNAAVVSDG